MPDKKPKKDDKKKPVSKKPAPKKETSKVVEEPEPAKGKTSSGTKKKK